MISFYWKGNDNLLHHDATDHVTSDHEGALFHSSAALSSVPFSVTWESFLLLLLWVIYVTVCPVSLNLISLFSSFALPWPRPQSSSAPGSSAADGAWRTSWCWGEQGGQTTAIWCRQSQWVMPQTQSSHRVTHMRKSEHTCLYLL